MEISKEFLTYLEESANKIDIHDLLHVGEKISSAFPKLIEMGRKGEIAYFEWQRKKYYTFMSEDEMYMTAYGETKEKVLKQRQEIEESRREKMDQKKLECQKIKEEKFPAIKKSIQEYFPPEAAENIIKSMLDQLDEFYYIFDLKRVETLLSLLKTAKTKPGLEAVKAYMESAGSPESRLFNYSILKKSYFGDIFMSALIADVRVEYGMHGDEYVQNIVQDIMENVQKAKEEYMKLQGLGNNLSELFDGESSTKGKKSSKSKGE